MVTAIIMRTPVNALINALKFLTVYIGNCQKHQNFSLSKFCAIRYIISDILLYLWYYDLRVNLVSHNLLRILAILCIHTPWE